MAEARREVVLIKLGGSLLTDKAKSAVLRGRRLARLAGELARGLAQTDLVAIVGHGSGSFGHVAAARHGFGGSEAEVTPEGVAAVQAAAADLHARVTEAFRKAGVAAFSLAPSSFIVTDDGRPRSAPLGPLLGAVESGLVPVTYGDVVMDRSRGASICSTETVLLAITRRLRRQGLRPRAAFWFGDTDGVYDADGRTIARIDPSDLRAILPRTGGAGVTDVTGGMRHRLAVTGRLSRLGVPSWILDGTRRGALEAVLTGTPVGGTHVPAAESGD